MLSILFCLSVSPILQMIVFIMLNANALSWLLIALFNSNYSSDKEASAYACIIGNYTLNITYLNYVYFYFSFFFLLFTLRALFSLLYMRYEHKVTPTLLFYNLVWNLDIISSLFVNFEKSVASSLSESSSKSILSSIGFFAVFSFVSLSESLPLSLSSRMRYFFLSATFFG